MCTEDAFSVPFILSWFILTSYSGFTLYRLVKKSTEILINCQAYANFKSQICDWERLTVFSQQLPQEPWILENSSRPLTEFLQF